MKKILTLLLIFIAGFILIFPLINADSIQPGYKNIWINNIITNSGDFPNYIFVSYGHTGPFCHIEIVEENGKISSNYYKLCTLSVYAIPKDNFNQSEINEYNNGTFSIQETENYLQSIGAKEVIKNIKLSSEVSKISTKESVTRSYTIDLAKTLQEPDKVEVKQNSLIYFYIIVPLIALIIILSIIFIKKKKKWIFS